MLISDWLMRVKSGHTSTKVSGHHKRARLMAAQGYMLRANQRIKVASDQAAGCKRGMAAHQQAAEKVSTVLLFQCPFPCPPSG